MAKKVTLEYLRRLINEINVAGPVPSARTITINGVTQDLSANRTWTVTASVSDGDKGDITVSGSGAIWTIDSGLDPSKLADGSVSATEFQYINSLSSNAQTQINARATITYVDSQDAAVYAAANAYTDAAVASIVPGLTFPQVFAISSLRL